MYDFKFPYSPADALRFLEELLPQDFKKFDENIELDFKPQHICKVKKIGEVSSLENLNVYEVFHESENDPRVSLSKDSFRLISDYGVRKALIFFTSKNSPNYRFSLVTVELTLAGSKVKKEYSNPRRYSFFLGPDAKRHTPEEYLIKPGKVKSLEDLKKRFSIEVVNKDFYNKISTLFIKLAGGKRVVGRKKIDEIGCLQMPSSIDHRKKQEFATRLLGRIIFCWFLKKKKSIQGNKLISDELLSQDAVKKCKNYYHTILEPLFFQKLNKPTTFRKDIYNDQSVPFLNGGLFQPHADDFYEEDDLSGLSKFVNTLKIPDSWFKDLFEILGSYNFTIDESTSVDVDLSIDPEILGRIFENLLAEINPETGETARKATGSYYTPRSVVEYMVDESLRHYLKNKTGIELKKISAILSYSEDLPEITVEAKEALLEALYELKILDPACGSGAFPMGILQKVVLALQKIDQDCKKWLDKQLAHLKEQYFYKVLKDKLKNENLDYIRKLGIIQNAVYGIDIQPLAIEKSKLRFFLSLIVDDDVDDLKENRGVHPLPNLEFKFICANSLVDIEELSFDEQDLFFEQFNKLTQYYFSVNDPKDKAKLQRGIEILIKGKVSRNVSEIVKLAKKYVISDDISKELKQKNQQLIYHLGYEGDLWESYLNIFKDEPVKFFKTKYFFPKIKDGFDIVIANPPYISIEKFARTEIQSVWKKIFKNTFASRGDVYCLFYEKGIELLREGGILTFINSNKFQRAGYGKGLRSFLSSLKIITLIDFCELPVFSASTDPMIIVISKENHGKDYKFPALVVKDESQISLLFKALEENSFHYKSEYLQSEGWMIQNDHSFDLVEKIRCKGKSLNNYANGRIYYGIKTGLNEAFVLNRTTRDDLIGKDKKAELLIKPWIRGKDIKRWKYEFNDLYVILFPLGFHPRLKEYPSIFEHLLKFEKKLKERGQCKTSRGNINKSQHHWLELDNNPTDLYIKAFDETKIVFNETSKNLHAYVDYEGNAINKTGSIVISPDIYFILAIMNSTVMDWFYRSTFPSWGDPWDSGRIQFRVNLMKNIPIPDASDFAKKQLSDLSKNAANLAMSNDTKSLTEVENKIDKIVYGLFDLKSNEVSYIEKSLINTRK